MKSFSPALKQYCKRLEKHNRTLRNITVFLFIVLIFAIIEDIQLSRYDRETYCCRHMARDEESFLEDFGIKTFFITGDQINGDKSHAWIALDIFGLPLHIDSVLLLPGIPLLSYENLTYYDSYDDYSVNKAMGGFN